MQKNQKNSKTGHTLLSNKNIKFKLDNIKKYKIGY